MSNLAQISIDLDAGTRALEACGSVSLFDNGGLDQEVIGRASQAMFALVREIETGEADLGNTEVRFAADDCRRYMESLRSLAERSGYSYSEEDNYSFAHFSRVLDGDLEAAANDEYSRALNASIEEVAAAAELECMEA